jgi:hypothetical protein
VLVGGKLIVFGINMPAVLAGADLSFDFISNVA